MKKKKYVWLLGVFLFIITVGFTACSDDDGPGSSADLVGTWQGVSSTGWYKENGKIVEQWEDEEEDSTKTAQLKILKRIMENGMAPIIMVHGSTKMVRFIFIMTMTKKLTSLL